jgi:DNA primase
MKYYIKTNTLHCFGECSRSYDVIDVVMLERGIDFISAVKLLN